MTEHSQAQAGQVLRFIREHVEAHGYPPSRRQIGEVLGHSSTSSTQRVLENMVRDGLIARDPGVPRGIRVVAKAETESM